MTKRQDWKILAKRAFSVHDVGTHSLHGCPENVDLAPVFRRVAPSPENPTLSAIQNENSLIFSASPFIGAADLLAALVERKDVRLGIATGHLSHAIAPALERFGWQRHFCTVQTADKAPSKPHPGMILHALSEAAVKAEDAIMIGDTAYDIEMARAADVRGVAVSWGYHRPDRLRDAGAWRVVNGMSELRDCLFESISSASHEP
ncbi:MAG TPA: HAD-IA family hydrolase [Pseudolabrys sp.]